MSEPKTYISLVNTNGLFSLLETLSKNGAHASLVAKQESPKGEVLVTMIPPEAFLTSDGFMLINSGDEWTDGDLTFKDKDGVPVEGDPILPWAESVEGKKVDYNAPSYVPRFLDTLVKVLDLQAA